MKKNLLVIQDKDAEKKIGDRKQEVATALKGTNYVNSVFPKSGKIVVNFKTEADRDMAANKIKNEVSESIVSNGNRRLPKIMICNVRDVDCEAGEDIVETLIDRNTFLQGIENVHEKIKFVFSKDAAGKTKHYILKCLDPVVRKVIRDHENKVMLKFSVYDIRDRYHAMTCFRCHRYGHKSTECRLTVEQIVCGICTGNHNSKDCPSTEDPSKYKCINCTRQKKEDTAHKAHSKDCIVYFNKMRDIVSTTDHGY